MAMTVELREKRIEKVGRQRRLRASLYLLDDAGEEIAVRPIEYALDNVEVRQVDVQGYVDLQKSRFRRAYENADRLDLDALE